MEKMRRQFMERNDLFGDTVKPHPQDKPQSHGRPRVPASPESVITISSTESSPAPASPPQGPRKGPVPTIVDSDDDDDVAVEARAHSSMQAASSKPQPTIKRLVWEDDDKPEIQEHLHLSKSRQAAATIPDGLKSTVRELLQQRGGFTKPPTAVAVPHLPPPAPQSQPNADAPGPLWEAFDEPDDANLYDPKMSAAEAERALQDLLSQSMNENSEEIDMRLATVEGFRENIKLMPHQVIGRVWMQQRESGKKAGGILADDMGLGKTIQTLTRIVTGRPTKSDKAAGYAAATLVVCPVSLVSQWASEIQKMAVGLRVIEHHGPSRTKDPEALRRAHVVVTSYSVLSSEHASYQQRQEAKSSAHLKLKKSASDSDDDEDDELDSDDGNFIPKKTKKRAPIAKKKLMDALFHIRWWRIVLDEAHNIKNRKTKAALACCALEGKYRWCLTGTPLQNNIEELFSLLKFLRIRPLNDWDEFNDKINKPVKSGRSARAMKRLQVVLKAIMLRRKKDGLLNGKPLIQLPARNLDIVQCEFDSDERAFYNALESKIEEQLSKFITQGDVSRNYTSVLVLLLRLRQACNHPSLISKDFSADKEAIEPKGAKDGQDLDDADDLAEMFGEMGVSASRKCQMCQVSLTSSNSSESATKYCNGCADLAQKARRKSLAVGATALPPQSTKIRMILEILDRIEERSEGKEKTIVFSQFTSMLDLIQPFLKDAGIQYVRYDGSMRKDEREKSLEAIRSQRSIKVILISFKAGSTGLNLTACNNVILVDMWWNPALEDQAFDRAHRFGQERDVHIYKLTITQSVEERILALQDKKRTLAAAALSGDKIKNARLGLEDLMTLFKHSGHDDEDD